MNKLLLRSIWINSALIALGTTLAIILARRAEHFGDLVFITMMMYTAGFLFLGNLLTGLVQIWRKQEWHHHLIVAFASVIVIGFVFLILTNI